MSKQTVEFSHALKDRVVFLRLTTLGLTPAFVLDHGTVTEQYHGTLVEGDSECIKAYKIFSPAMRREYVALEWQVFDDTDEGSAAARTALDDVNAEMQIATPRDRGYHIGQA